MTKIAKMVKITKIVQNGPKMAPEWSRGIARVVQLVWATPGDVHLRFDTPPAHAHCT